MPDPSLTTAEMNIWLDRLQAGDETASDPLVRRASEQLERLVRKMTRRFPRLSRFVDSEDILQAATMRLLRALRTIRPASTREFYALAATQIRRELLDVTKSLFGVRGAGARTVDLPEQNEPSDGASEDRELDKWDHFHRAVERLPVAEREVMGLVFYHGWKQEQVAELFQVSVRTVQRWWQSAVDTMKTDWARS
jgi:RNA polymerase sigma-70 factor (ECF subfamily)